MECATALGLSGAVDEQDLDQDAVRDGEAGGKPNFQARIGLSYPLGDRRFSLGLWYFSSSEEVAEPIGGRTSFDGRVAGVDFEVPLGDRLGVRGESWKGSNLSDVRGGVGQSVNVETGEAIDSWGGWIELGGELLPSYQAFVGYTLDNPDDDEVPEEGRTRNGAVYVTNRFTLGSGFTIGVDLLRWRTEYRGLPDGSNNRINTYLIYSF